MNPSNTHNPCGCITMLKSPPAFRPIHARKERPSSLSIRLALRVSISPYGFLTERLIHSHDHRTSGKSQFHGSRHTGYRYRNRSEDYSEDYSDEYWGQIGVVQLLRRVSHNLFHTFYRLTAAHHNDPVAHLQDKIACGQKFYSTAVDQADIYPVDVP